MPSNRAPTISGQPPATATVGATYTFAPLAADADGDTLTFSILNRPAWAAFDPGTGRLSGTPVGSSVGTSGGILITVSDGKTTTSLASFDVRVAAAVSAGSAIVEWDAPTTNLDGSALADLGSYRVVYGQAAGALSQAMTVTDKLATSAQVGGLAPGTWYFAVRAINAAGQESPLSNIASKVIP